MPSDFESLMVKMSVVATNYLDRNEMAYCSEAGSCGLNGNSWVEYGGGVLIDCEFRRNPATDSDLMPAGVPI